MQFDYKQEIDVMLSCMRKIGDLLMKYFEEKSYNVSMKGINNPVTEADLASNSLLITTIQQYFPQDAVLSEEVFSEDHLLPDRHQAERVWIIDPIDGTKEFIEGLPEFSISVGLIINNQPVLGFIFNPAQNFFIHGGKGVGIFVNSKPLCQRKPSPQIIEELYPCFSRSEFNKGLFEQYHARLPINEQQVFGSIAYKLGLVVSDQFNFTLSYRPKNEWDIAAGLCLFEEIGYVMTDLNYQDIRLNKKNTRSAGIIAGSPEAMQLYKNLVDDA